MNTTGRNRAGSSGRSGRKPVPQARAGGNKRRTSKKRRQTAKLIRLILMMLVFALLTFMLTSLVSGNGHRLGQAIRGLFTPDAPRLILKDTGHEYKVKELKTDFARELIDSLSTSSRQETESGGAADITAGAGAKNLDSFQRLFAKNDYTPPTIDIYKNLSQSAAFEKAPSSVSGFLVHGSRTIPISSLDAVNQYEPEKDGVCYALLEAVWDASTSIQTSRRAVYCFAMNFDRPAVFEINTTELDPGELLVFYADYLTSADTVTAQSGLPLSLTFSPYGEQEMIALAALSYDIKPGVYTTTLSAGDVSQSFEITVKDKDFAVQNVTVDPTLAAATRNETTTAEFTEKVTPVLTESLPALEWDNQAQWPVNGMEMLTNFGARRYINQEANSYRHSGVDLKADKGSEVLAINNGKVIFSEELAYTGNTIIIEHGLGLKSWYYHMDARYVSAGDTVNKGDVIGTVGDTGFATSPHLHLNVSVNSTYINPLTALNTSLFREPKS